jgi:hypothetical protein
MTELEKIKAVCKRLNIPEADYMVGGSGSMVLHGIDRKLGDLDIFTTTKQWFRFQQNYQLVSTDEVNKEVASRLYEDPVAVAIFGYKLVIPDDEDYHRFDPPILRYDFWDLELKVDLFYSWKIRNHQTTTDLEYIWNNHRSIVNGIPTSSLEWLRNWKAEAGRDKDLEDIKLIDEYLDRAEEVPYYGP